MSTKQQKILEHLQSGRPLTPRDAVQLYNCYSLAATVFALKKKGYKIITVLEHKGTTQWAKYSMMYEHGFNRQFQNREKSEPKKINPVKELFEIRNNPERYMP